LIKFKSASEENLMDKIPGCDILLENPLPLCTGHQNFQIFSMNCHNILEIKAMQDSSSQMAYNV
jgi:hypothetical protein